MSYFNGKGRKINEVFHLKGEKKKNQDGPRGT